MRLSKGEDLTDAKIADNNVHYVVKRPFVEFDQLKTPFTPLITFNNRRMRGEDWTVLYVGELPMLPVDRYVTFGDSIQLRGFTLSPKEVCPGDPVDMRLLWGATRAPDRYYSYFLHLSSDQTGEISGPINGQQPVGDNRPTISWTTPDELLVGPEQSPNIPDDLQPGVYEVWLGLYDPISGDHLYLPDGKHYTVLGTLQVKDCDSTNS